MKSHIYIKFKYAWRFANTLPFYSLASVASNFVHSKRFQIILKYWTPKGGIENKVLSFFDDRTTD